MTFKPAAIAGLIAIFAPASVSAFVQTMTCDASGQYQCGPGETPKPVRWADRCVHYYVNEAHTADISDDSRTIAAVQRSFTTWNEVEGTEFLIEYAGLTNEDRAEHVDARGPEGNANVVVWRDTDWPYASRTAFAITSVTFDPGTGLIADADIELNSESHRFTTGSEGVIVDVSNTITHEVGHFLGLDHTAIKEATMYGSAPEGETEKRSLHPDDVAGLMATYPAVGIVPACPDVPDYFEQPQGVEKKGCCATATSPAPSGGAFLLLLAVFGILHRRRDR